MYMKTQIKRDWKRFMVEGAYCSPPGRAACALAHARTLDEWRTAESAGLVRLRAEPESESLASVYGDEIAEREREYAGRWGVWWVVSEVNFGNEAIGDKWEHADSIGMCVYENPLDPFQNCYVVDLMAAALRNIPQPGNVDELCTSLES